MELIRLESSTRRIKDATGASFLGNDSAQFPAWWADVVMLIETQDLIVRNRFLD